MRTTPLLLLALLAGCGAPAEGPGATEGPAAETAGKSTDAGTRATAVRESPATKPARGFASPLPGGVVPDFDYVLIVDMSSRANFTMRQVSIGATDLRAEVAMDRLAAQFASAGFTLGEASEHRKARMLGLWKGGHGARGMVVVSEGGTYINVIATDADPDKQAENGWMSLLALTIYTPL